LNLPEDLDTTGGSYSLLALDRLSFGDTVFFSLGGRIVQFDANQKDVLAPQVFGPGTNVDTSQLTFNPSAGALVKPSHNSSLYFSYAESTNSFNNLSAITADRGTVDPERSHAFEMGAKMEFLQGRLFATADVFQITKENVVAPDPHDPIFSVNAGKERSRGFECEINGTPIPGWRLSLAYTYTDARIISAPEDLNVGHRFFGVPYNSGGFFSTYEFQNGLLKGFGLGAGETVSGNVQVTNEDTGRLAGWAETDLVAFYRRGNFRVQINVKNLFDNEYYYARNDLFTVQPAQARTIIGTVSVQF
jgi:iron complex outermembrane receptor protein